MTKKLEFFFDYVSPYSYLANSQLNSVKEIEIQFRPMFLGGVMKATGNKPPGALPVRGKYLTKDIKRWAKHYEISFKFNSIFPQNTLKSLRLSLAAQNHGVFNNIHQSLFDAMFVYNQDLSQDSVLVEIIKKNSLDDYHLMEEIENPSIKSALKQNTDEAIARGAFGAPTFFIDEEMFFGNDRFEFIKKALSQKYER